jgi:hypothetical protein
MAFEDSTMPLIRMTMFFNMSGAGSHSAGWSETHYSITALTLPGALTNLVALAQLRVNLLGAGVTLRYLRVSDDLVDRDVRAQAGLTPHVGAHGPYYLGTWASSPADFAYSAALVRLQGASDFYTRNLFLSGIPDLNQDIEHPSPFTAAWLQQFVDFRNALLSGRYGFKITVRGPANPDRQITGLAAGVFTTSGNHGFNPNDPVRIRGFRANPGTDSLGNPNGTWRVQFAPSPTTFSLLGYAQLTFNPTRLGTVRKIIPDVTPYTNVSTPLFTKRSRGRPFGLLVGRRRRRAH